MWAHADFGAVGTGCDADGHVLFFGHGSYGRASVDGGEAGRRCLVTMTQPKQTRDFHVCVPIQYTVVPRHFATLRICLTKTKQ